MSELSVVWRHSGMRAEHAGPESIGLQTQAEKWIPGARFARPGMTAENREIRRMVFAALYPFYASFPDVRLEVAKMSQLTMKMAAISGPMTKPFKPKTSMPPSVEISTT